MGIKCEQFVKKVDENLHCPICREVFEDPVSCKDGHAFCSECIKEWLKSGTTCPSDNTVLQEECLVRVLTVKGIIDNLDVYCHHQDTENDKPNIPKKIKLTQENDDWFLPEQFWGEKCSWTGKVQELETHTKKCIFQAMQCPHLHCTAQVRRRDLENHIQSCQYKIVSCKDCQAKVVQCDLQCHQDNNCPNALVPCPYKCYVNEEEGNKEVTKIKRISVDEHLKVTCKRAIVSCPFDEQGCGMRFMRKDTNNHLKEYLSSHMMLVAKETTKLKKELLAVKLNLKTLQDELPNSYIWNINYYSSLFAGQYPKVSRLRSPAFWLCGYRWYLLIYPSGNDKAPDYLSIYLELVDEVDLTHSAYTSSAYLPNSHISASFRLSVLSQTPGTDDVSFKTSFLFSKNSSGVGWPKFMKAADVLSTAYCNSVNGSVIIKCTIVLDKPR